MTITHHHTALQTRLIILLALTLFGPAGCATSSDMDQFRQSLNQRLDVMTAGQQADARRIPAQLEGPGKRQQDLARSVDGIKSALETDLHAIRTDLDALKTETKTAVEELVKSETVRAQLIKDLRVEGSHLRKALDEYATKTHQELGRIEAVAQDGSKEIRNLEQALAAFSMRLEQLPAIVNQLGSEVHSLSQTLVGGYRLEEAALRDRLKSVEQVLKHLEPTAVHTSQASSKATQAAQPHPQKAKD
jgi:chromosome segregation ATPase